MICELYLKADTHTHTHAHAHTQLVYAVIWRKTNEPEIFFPEESMKAKVKFFILLKLILVDGTKDGIKYRAMKLSITQHIC